MIAVAETIPPALKIKADESGRRIEKWILRKALQDLLPPDVLWRDKEQFDEGSGLVDHLPQVVERAGSGVDAQAYRGRFANDRLRSKEECLYHLLLRERFERPQSVLANVGRWRLDR